MKFRWLLWSVSSVCVLDWCVQYERERSGPAGGEDMCGDSLVRPSWWCLFSQWMAEATSDINIRNNGGITLHLRSVCDLASRMWWIQYPLSATSWGVLKRAQWGEVLKCTLSMAEATHGSRLSALVTSTPPSGVRMPAPSGEWWHSGARAQDYQGRHSLPQMTRPFLPIFLYFLMAFTFKPLNFKGCFYLILPTLCPVFCALCCYSIFIQLTTTCLHLPKHRIVNVCNCQYAAIDDEGLPPVMELEWNYSQNWIPMQNIESGV